MYLKISKFLENLAFKIRQKALYFELKHYIKSGEDYLKPVFYCTRSIGKTYTLIQLAYKFKCPIIVSTMSMGKYIERLAKEMHKKVEVFGCNGYSLHGKRFKLALCEEGIDNISMQEIIRPMCKQIVGYKFIN